jgi:hypothetical protein
LNEGGRNGGFEGRKEGRKVAFSTKRSASDPKPKLTDLTSIFVAEKAASTRYFWYQ